MMNMENYVYCNNKFVSTSQCDFHSHSSSGVLYEVVRVIDGIPLFLEDHILRLWQSAGISGFKGRFPEYSFFEGIFHELINLNNTETGNIQINIIPDKTPCIYSSFIPHTYPADAYYTNGVKTDFLFAERKTPEAKVIQKNLRERANEMIKIKKLFEVILVDRHEMVTEGSRSNVFIIAKDSIYTAPLNMVLEGITRKKALAILQDMNLEIIEKPWKYYDVVDKADAMFITGTSPKIMPVMSCDGANFNVDNEVVREVMKRYNRLIGDYIKKKKA